MPQHATAPRLAEIATLGERLSALRLCDAGALAAMRRSLEQQGQLCALTLFVEPGRLEIVDGFKRVRAARALGWSTLLAHVCGLDAIDAKLCIRELHDGQGLTEIEEAWLVRSLYREDGVPQPEIARRLRRHKTWVWRRLMLVETLDPLVQADVRLGLIAPRAAAEVSRLPRGNQRAASAVVVRRGLTVRQTAALVEEVLTEPDPAARVALLARRLDERVTSAATSSRPERPTRTARSDADRMSIDILRMLQIAARLETRPLDALTPAAAELIREALARLAPVLRVLDDAIAIATGPGPWEPT